MPAARFILLLTGFLAMPLSSLIAAEPAPASPAVPPPAPPSVYALAKADAVRIEVFQEPELTTEARLDENGAVRMPLLDAVRLAGLTIPEAEAAIEKALAEAELIRRAHVSVRIIAFALREVMITGQVRAPGSYPLPAEGGMTLIDLISRAGGLTELARGSATRTRVEESGEKRTITVDAASLLRGKGNTKAPELILQAGDIVFVPERIF